MAKKKINSKRKTSSSSKLLKSYSNTNRNDSPDPSTIVMLENYTSETKNSENSLNNSQINEEECKFIINILKSDDVDLHSQNEEALIKIVKKYEKHILPLSNENMELNTQTCMDLLLQRATADLQNHQDLSKNKTTEYMASNDIIATPPFESEELNSKQNNEDVIAVKNDQDQDPDLIAFRDMCNGLLNIAALDNVTLNSSMTEKNNQENHLMLKQVNADVLVCTNNSKCVPGPSKLNSTMEPICSKPDAHIPKHVDNRKRIFVNSMFDSSEERSPEYLNELSQKQNSRQNKKLKYSKNILKNNTECHSDSIVIEKQVNDSKNINTFVRKEENGFFYCAPNGIIHQDMLAYINKQKYGC